MFKRFILWDFPRGSWQYDVMVGVIVAFIFLTPRDWFRDQPRIPQASKVTMLASEHGTETYWLDLELLQNVAPERYAARAEQILRTRTNNKKLVVSRVEPHYDSEKVVQGYFALAKP